MKLALAAAIVVLASSPAHADESDPFDGGTIALQSTLGVVGGAIGGGMLGLAGAGVGHVLDRRHFEGTLFGGFLGAVGGAAIGIVWAVDYAGNNAGANGSVLGTALGTGAGIATFVTFEVALAKFDKNPPAAAHVLLAIATAVGGAVIGYQLSADDRGRRTKVTAPITGFVF